MSENKLQQRNIGVIFGVLTALCVTGYITTNKYIYAHYDISAIEYSLIFAMTGAFFAGISLIRQIDKKSIENMKNHSGSLMLLGIAGAIAVALFTIGQNYTTAVNAALLVTATVVATPLFSHIILKEQLSKAQGIWMIVMFIGLYIGIVGFQALHFLPGDVIVLTSVLFFGFGNAYSRLVMKRMGSAKLVPDVRLVIGGVLSVLFAVVIIKHWSVVVDMLPFALLAGFFYWLCMKVFARSVYLINANNAVVLANAAIFFTSITGVILLSEPYSIEKFIGSIIAITAIYFIAAKQPKSKSSI